MIGSAARILSTLVVPSAVAIAIAACSPAIGSPIQYTMSCAASGTIGSQPFTNSAITITVSGDTANIVRQGSPPFWSVLGTASIFIAGIGDATLSTPTYVFNNGTVFGLGRVDGPTDVLDLFVPGLANYGLNTPFGPALATNQHMNWTESPVISDHGTVILTSAGPFTIQAVVPVPATACVVALGGLVAARRRHRSSPTCVFTPSIPGLSS